MTRSSTETNSAVSAGRMPTTGVALTAGLLLALLCTSTDATARQDGPEKMKPEETEVWEPEPPIVTAPIDGSAPSDAIVLFDGTDLSAWTNSEGGKAGWTVADRAATVVARSGAIKSRQAFGDVQLHIEWRTPATVVGNGQGRGNSGVFLMEKYELQVLDSYQNRTYSNGQAGSIYKQHIPLVNASRPPGVWQTYDVVFEAPRFKADGAVEKKAYMTVFHNGVLIHNRVELQGPTVYVGRPGYEAHPPKLPILLQDHGNPTSFRNIWVREL